ncbi:uncharacterized protein CDV56_101469 [Aspergillus thermomutatus]|uniref:Uncharacterized protein n=1 Tax=Aspergillus thermomutatus TaxID=41047 RepID=A0A397GB65_ASPTH|nr:uncharacterized protein CDV56_101469 [Aspergillus thermomutatus]RHZ48191.1 hypothetical protein CDV56_101469 [Aspergillus thermomutatus]
MQAILAMHTGTFQCKTYGDADYFIDSDIRPADRIIASSTHLRKFVRLAHHIHVLAHLCIESSIQQCLKSPLGQRQYPRGFEIPTWTEEQRTVLAFWRVMFWNELKIKGSMGSLGWSPGDLRRLASSGAYQHFTSNAMVYEAFTALFFIARFPLVESSLDPSQPLSQHPFKLPRVPHEKEFSWVCEPPPSSRAITQGRSFEQCGPSLEAMLSAQQGAQQKTQQRPDKVCSQEDVLDLRHEPSPEASPEPPSQPHPDLTGEPEEPHRLGARRFFYGTDSDEESEDDSQLDTAEDLQEDTDDEESSSSSSSDSSWAGPVITRGCLLLDRSPSPEEFYIRNRVHPYEPRPVHDYGPQSQRPQEWEDLGREPLGVQFWRSMVGNPEAGPAKYMYFQAYVRYGFAIWEEQRMVQLGMWSHSALANPLEYYRRWYTFLRQEDIDRWKQNFRYFDDDDYE